MPPSPLPLAQQEAENSVELMRVHLAVATELKRKDLVEAQRHNSVLHCRFEGQGAGEYIAAFLEALPESMSPQAKQTALDSHSGCSLRSSKAAT